MCRMFGGPYDPIPFFDDPLMYGLMICAVVFIYLLISEIKSRLNKKL
jgi:hypothetical protein